MSELMILVVVVMIITGYVSVIAYWGSHKQRKKRHYDRVFRGINVPSPKKPIRKLKPGASGLMKSTLPGWKPRNVWDDPKPTASE